MLRIDVQLQEVILITGRALAATEKILTLFAYHHILALVYLLIAMVTFFFLRSFKWQLNHIASIFTGQFLEIIILCNFLHIKQLLLEFHEVFV